MSESNARVAWRDFCDRYRVAEVAVPLFAADYQGRVKTRLIGKGDTQRYVLVRSPAMEALVRTKVQALTDDWQSGAHEYDGLIYCMCYRTGDEFEPLYIGKAETVGKGGGNLSSNLQRLGSDTSKFARWGDNYAYHIGDLSACALPGHAPDKVLRKYTQWANRLFIEIPSAEPRLRTEVHFWAVAWKSSNIGIWRELGSTRLTFLEYMLIGVASMAFPTLLNREGVNR